MAKLIFDYPKMLDYFTIAKLSDKIRLAVLPASDGVSASALNDVLQKMLSSMQTNHPEKVASTPPGTATNAAPAAR